MNEDTKLQPTTEAVVVKRLPEVKSLKNNVRDETVRLFIEEVPEYFWVARSSKNYHPPDERGLGGLWLHTKRVFFAWTMIENTLRAMNVIDAVDAQSARSAALLHDAFKYDRYPENDDREDYHPYALGRLSNVRSGTIPEHDVLMADVIENESDLSDRVADCVRTHGGSPSWTVHSGPRPSDDLTLGLHMADLIASNQHHKLPVWNPHDVLDHMVATEIPKIEDSGWLGDLE